MPANDRLMKLWDSLAQAILPPDVHPVQYTEMRRAFFGGAQAVLGVMIQISADNVSEEEGAAVLQELSMELDAFGERVGTGNY
jgi:hypothetical protein